MSLLDRVNFYEVVARKKLGVGAEWRWCGLELIGPDATLVTGGVPRVLKSGPNKGKVTWKGIANNVVVVTDAEWKAAENAWVAETGLCPECQGSGQEAYGVSADGTKYRPCNDCDATGKAMGA